MKNNYYVRLNEYNIGIEIISRPTKLPETQGYVSIPDYNEMYLYRKYDPVTKWSQETYEPDVDLELYAKVEALELENNVAKSEVVAIQQQNNMMEGMLMEMMEMLATLTTPVGGVE